MRRKALFAASSLVLLTAALMTWGAPRGGDAPLLRRNQPHEHEFPNTVLRTHEGRDVRFYDDLIKDKIVLINFMYTNCQGI
jgi:protein SCO1/2